MKSIAAGFMAGLFVCTALPAASQTAVPASAPGVTRATLANGLKVVIVRNDLAPVASMAITYSVGGDDDTIAGIAHATEHMMFRGTKSTSADQFAAIATRAGADYNAATTNHYTEFHFTVPSAYIYVVLHLEADRMTNATIGASEWKNERGAIEQEVQAHQGTPLSNVNTRINDVFFGDSPYARDPVGTIDGFNRMTAANIASFYHTWYHPNNATLVIAGDVDPAAMLAAVHREFDAIPAVKVPAHPTIAYSPPSSERISQSIDIPEEVVALAYPLPGYREPDYAAAEVLDGALNNSRGDLTSLVVAGQVYQAQSSEDSYPEITRGELMALGKSYGSGDSTLELLQGVVADYRNNGIPLELVEAAKTRLLAAHDYQSSSIGGEREAWQGSLSQGAESPDGLYDAIAKVTPDDVNRIFREAVDPKHMLQIILTGRPSGAVSHADFASQGENVAVIAKENAALPAWTKPYFSAPLAAPLTDDLTKITHMKNGMTIAVRRETTSPTVVVNAAIRNSAQLYEPVGKEGVAAVTRALMALGTTTYDYKQYSAQIDAIAATITVGPSFALTARAADFDRAVELLANGELSPAFSPAMFDLVRSNYARSLSGGAQDPSTVAGIARVEAIFPEGDPRRRRATPESVYSLTLDDVKKWYAFAYRPDLTAMTIVGDVSPETATATIDKYFGGWQATGTPPTFEFPPVPLSEHATSVTVNSPTTTQSHVSLAQAIGLKGDSNDAIALRVANTILSGEGTGSLLFRDVRSQHGLVYSIDSNIDFARDSSIFGITFASDSGNVDRAQASAMADLEKMRTQLLPALDIERAKEILLSSELLPLGSYGGLSDALLGSLEDSLDGGSIENYYTRMLAVTPTEVRDAMHRWIDPAHFTRVILAPGN